MPILIYDKEIENSKDNKEFIAMLDCQVFGDKRISAAVSLLITRMQEEGTAILRRLGGNRATEVKFGRILKNKKVTMDKLLETITSPICDKVSDLHVLAIQDTSEINFQSNAGRVSGLGTVGHGTGVGLFIHPMLTLDADSGACLGLSAAEVWCRHKKKAANYGSLPIEEKESNRWLSNSIAAKKQLKKAKMVTIIADRESDIYEEWARIPDDKTHLITRVSYNRLLLDGNKLYSYTDDLPVESTYDFDVPRRKNRAARTAKMEVRFSKVSIKRPAKKSKDLPESIELFVVDTREIDCEHIPKKDRVHWRIFTTHKVETVKQALQIVAWYRERWNIEQLFRTMKKQGLDIESSQLETADKLMKLVVLAMHTATRTMQLVLSRDSDVIRPISDVFNAEEEVFLQALLPTLEGKRRTQMNCKKPNTLSWATWIIARLGGWKGYRSEAKPGPITMKRGLDKFYSQLSGWEMANAFQKSNKSNAILEEINGIRKVYE
ncbi:MAG: IS4 family transposase [Mariprofundales bacterium]